MQNSLLNTHVTTIDGEVTTLEKYAGKVLLIVNVASRCGLTPQYEQLENIQKAWADQGFVVLGFPCNQFMGQEPGSEEEIKTYCASTWGVTFPMFSKIDVNGDARHPLYQKLIAAAPTAVAPEKSGFYERMVSKGRTPLYPDDILWNPYYPVCRLSRRYIAGISSASGRDNSATDAVFCWANSSWRMARPSTGI